MPSGQYEREVSLVSSSVYAHRGFKVGVFLDSVNIHVTVKNTYEGKEPDHGKLLKEAVADNHLHRAIVYCVNLGSNFDQWKKALSRYGFEFREKQAQRFADGTTKGDVDMELAMDVWRSIDQVDMVVLMTCDGDFTALVDRCHELGKIVRVFGVPGSTNPLLVKAADEFVPITEAMLRTKNGTLKKES